MMKKLLALCLMMTLACAALGAAWAEEIVWEDYYTSTVLDPDYVEDFFSVAGLNVIYNQLGDDAAKQNNVYALNFTATQDPPAEYADYIADFVLTSDKDVTVYLVGYYQDYQQTVPLGPVELKAGEEFRVLKYFGKAVLDYDWDWTYDTICSFVKSFDCAAIPITAEVAEAFEKAGAEFMDLSNPMDEATYGKPLAKMPAFAYDDTTLSLDLRLYENKALENEIIVTNKAFTYTSDEADNPEQTLESAPVYTGQSEPMQFHLTGVAYEPAKAAAYLYKLPDLKNPFATFYADTADSSQIVFEEGSITVKLQPEYLSQLPKGDYVLTVDDDKNDDVTYEGNQFTVAGAASSAPKTGDSANLLLWAALCAGSLLSLLALRRRMAAR